MFAFSLTLPSQSVDDVNPGLGPSEFLQEDKRAPMRFGKRAPMRFGKRAFGDDLDELKILRTVRAPMRFGKRSIEVKRAPMRFGKRNQMKRDLEDPAFINDFNDFSQASYVPDYY